MADEIDADSSPDGNHHTGKVDAEAPDRGLRQFWQKVPPGLRTVLPLALLVSVVIVGFYNWVRPSRDDWSHLPDRLVCQMQSVTRPPPALVVDSVGVSHPRADVLRLVVHFAQPLPAAPSYQLTYRLANNGTPFAVLTQRPGSDDLAISNTRSDGSDIRTDLGTHARRTAPDTVEMTLNLPKFGIQKDFVSPTLAVSSQLDARGGEPMAYALQVCHG